MSLMILNNWAGVSMPNSGRRWMRLPGAGRARPSAPCGLARS
ncbi:hypothetical protein L541_1550 [Bordetella hinzii CA90 BAL1384]|nr:hypothetical protein L541_1550 [Bordetella hinzii CA90 BAL1384]